MIDQTEKIVGSGIYTTNTNPVATDSDVGQDLTYTVVYAESTVRRKVNLVFHLALVDCLQRPFTDPFVAYLCVTACDDQTFLGAQIQTISYVLIPFRMGILSIL